MADPQIQAAVPLLDLDVLTTRPFITFRGERYDLKDPGELVGLQYHRVVSLSQRAFALERKEDPTAEDEAALYQIGDEVSRIVLVDMPPEVFASLTKEQRYRIAVRFSELWLQMRLGTAGANPTTTTTSHPTGARSLLGSPGSTAARRWFGWLRRRSQS